MKIYAVYPSRAHSAYKIAAKTFAALATKIFSCSVCVLSDLEHNDSADLDTVTVLFGNDSVNKITAELYLSKQTDSFKIRYGTDDYCIRSINADGREFLLLCGGRPRATIYATYRFFELFCGCRWFWDGDRIPSALFPKGEIDITESPRFDYRGLRYFAHRSLHRFQAEQWGFDDWKAEIDWILKKRLNLFMLRIGTDDLFQSAFPDIVGYPKRDEKLPEASAGYDDRTLFWSLEYRGELRKKILEYAFERDLWHPEDCGTMTHWYSRTPIDFLNKVNPTLLSQTSRHYNDPTGRVWDIREDENFENYFKLTKAHIQKYGKPELFHTIGLGERRYSADRETNQRMKLYVYRKIAGYVRENFPNAPLFIASWDLWQQFTADEVQALVSELDPNRTIIWDYTSDAKNRTTYKDWGVLNKFPWVFGIFSAFEPNSEIRGHYEHTNACLAEAKADNNCRGLIFWPELSHGDPFVIEYFAKNAWEHETRQISELIDEYCADRYQKELSSSLAEIWHVFMPVASIDAWSSGGEYRPYGDDMFFTIRKKTEFAAENLADYKDKLARYSPYKNNAAKTLRELALIPLNDDMTKRDAFDIARTALCRYINAAIFKAEELYASRAPIDELSAVIDICEALMACLIGVLSLHSDYSLYASLEHLKSVTDTNPNFEHTLKNNAECAYCRSFIFENAKYLYLPEMKALFGHIKDCRINDIPYDASALDESFEQIRYTYFETPLKDMSQKIGTFDEHMKKAAELIDKLVL